MSEHQASTGGFDPRALHDTITRLRADQADLVRQSVFVAEMIAGNATASRREQGIRDLIDAIARVCGRCDARLADLLRTQQPAEAAAPADKEAAPASGG